MASDRELIQSLERQVDELSRELHNVVREFANFKRETLAALRWLKEHLPPSTVGNAVEVRIEAEPLTGKDIST